MAYTPCMFSLKTNGWYLPSECHLCGPVSKVASCIFHEVFLYKRVLKKPGQQHALWWSTKKPSSVWLTLLILSITHPELPSSWHVSKGGRGRGRGEGNIKSYLLHLKKGGKGEKLCLHSPHSTSLSNGTMMFLKRAKFGHLHSEYKYCS